MNQKLLRRIDSTLLTLGMLADDIQALEAYREKFAPDDKEIALGIARVDQLGEALHTEIEDLKARVS